ncbi:HAD family hydrolase [Desulfoscipio gibsoniae]
MIFASDLDRTLIYSQAFVSDYPASVKAVETGDYYSYMTENAAELLKDLAGRLLFVPCTTRTVEQYRRIGFFQNELRCRYAVTSNGANLLVDGAPDAAYRSDMLKALAHNCAAGMDILQGFGRLSGAGWAGAMRHADEAFYYCIVERDNVPLDELAEFSDWAAKQNWHVSLQGRKLYLVPRAVNKWSALQRVLEMAGDDKVAAAGDSLLDLPLVQGADYAISPAHGELYEQYGGYQLDLHARSQSQSHKRSQCYLNPHPKCWRRVFTESFKDLPNNKQGACSRRHWIFTESSGLAAGEEIIKTVMQLLRPIE